jgi:DNA-binding NarL/FixJ family response regulator
LLVDDHKVVAEGLVRLLCDRYDVIDILTDGRLVLETVRRLRPDVILIDLSMPHVSGLEVLRRLKEQRIAFRAIVLTMHADAHIAVEALRIGACGFVLKESSGQELLKALDVVLGGGTYLAMAMTKEVLMLMVGSADPARFQLTPRQQEVLRLIVRGHRAKEIAATLDLSTRSVEAIKYRVMHILQVHSTAELVRYAIEHQVVTY